MCMCVVVCICTDFFVCVWGGGEGKVFVCVCGKVCVCVCVYLCVHLGGLSGGISSLGCISFLVSSRSSGVGRRLSSLLLLLWLHTHIHTHTSVQFPYACAIVCVRLVEVVCV